MDYDAIMQDLLEATAASRTTLRLDHPTLNYPVAGEACAPGVPSIRHDNSIDQRGGATAQWILRTGRILVVEDARNSDPGAAAGDRRRLRPARVPAHPAAEEVSRRAARLDLGAREPRHPALDAPTT